VQTRLSKLIVHWSFCPHHWHPPFLCCGYGNINDGCKINSKTVLPGNLGKPRPEALRHGVHNALAVHGVTSYESLPSAMPVVLNPDKLGAAVPAGCHMDLLSVLGCSILHVNTLTSELLDVVQHDQHSGTNAERAEFHRKFGVPVMKGTSSDGPPPKVCLKELPCFSGEIQDWGLWKDNVCSMLLQCGLHKIITDPDCCKKHEVHSKMVYGMILEVLNKPSCKADYLCEVDETGEMNGCVLWSRLEETFESPQILKHVLKIKVQELTSLSCEKAESFTQFVRDFMKLCKTCTACHETIRKLNHEDTTWTLPSTEKEWKESFASKTGIASLLLGLQVDGRCPISRPAAVLYS
jgi:hypothetical protein